MPRSVIAIQKERTVKAGQSPYQQIRALIEIKTIYTFVTWEYTYGRSGVHWGHYTGDYAAAKEDFAVRAGLVQENRLFSQEQCALLHHTVTCVTEESEALSPQEEKEMEALLQKWEGNIPKFSSPVQETEMEMGGM